jgi:hypothetical protein
VYVRIFIKDTFNKGNEEFLAHFHHSRNRWKNCFSEVLNIQRAKEYTIPSIWHLIIQQLSSPKTRCFAFYQIKASSPKQVNITDMFKKTINNVCTSTVTICPDPLPPTPSTSSAMRTPENTQ